MKTNDEKIFKYLADMLDENEKSDFEKEILKSSKLKTKLKNIQNQLYSLQVDANSLDERYFNNLLPRVRQQLDAKSNTHIGKKIYYLVPYIAAVIVGLLFLFRPTYNFDNVYKDLANKVVNSMTDQDVASKYFEELDTEPAFLVTTNNDDAFGTLVPSNLEVNNEDASNIINVTGLDEYSAMYNYSDDQLKVIAANLNKLNIK